MAPSHRCLGAGSTVPRVISGLLSLNKVCQFNAACARRNGGQPSRRERASAGGPDGRVAGGPDGRVDRARAELNGNPVSREKKYDAITSHSMYPKVGYF